MVIGAGQDADESSTEQVVAEVYRPFGEIEISHLLQINCCITIKKSICAQRSKGGKNYQKDYKANEGSFCFTGPNGFEKWVGKVV
ncbi:MAG: hypothetical protein PHQ35_05850 [Phycisphaerae bacterium]|nr:hypothetical protein [Phycisphaerae bacterium]